MDEHTEHGGVEPGDIVMVVEGFVDHEGHIGIVTDRADPGIWSDEFWVVFGRDEPATDEGSDRIAWHYPPSSLVILGRATVVGDVGRGLLWDLVEAEVPA